MLMLAAVAVAAAVVWGAACLAQRLVLGVYAKYQLRAAFAKIPLPDLPASGESIHERIDAYSRMEHCPTLYKECGSQCVVNTTCPEHAPLLSKMDRAEWHPRTAQCMGPESVLFQHGDRATRDRIRLGFAFERLQEDFFPLMRSSAARLRQRLEVAQQGFFPQHEFEAVSFEILCDAGFGVGAMPPDAARGDFSWLMGMSSYAAVASLIPGGGALWSLAQRCRLRHFNGRMAALQQAAMGDHSTRYSLLRMMMALPEEVVEGTSKQTWVGNNLTLLMCTGPGPLSSALVFTSLMLAMHPQRQDRVHAEIQSITDHEQLTFAMLERLTFTEAVIKETLRLYPPMPLGTARNVRGGELAAVSMSTARVDVLNMHRRPDYFSRPNEFLPERWLEGSGETATELGFMPFATAHGACLGANFAMMELKTVLVTLLLGGRCLRLWDAMPALPDAKIENGLLTTTQPTKLLLV